MGGAVPVPPQTILHASAAASQGEGLFFGLSFIVSPVRSTAFGNTMTEGSGSYNEPQG